MTKNIAIVAPAGAIDEVYIDKAAERLQAWGQDRRHAWGQDRLQAWGQDRLDFEHSEALHNEPEYQVRIMPHARGRYGRFAANDQERTDDLNNALGDPAIDIILCTRGGYGMQRIVDRIAPITKPIVGFSDITCLHQLAALSGQASLHGLMCKHIATLPDEAEPLRLFRRALAGETLDYTLPPHPLNRAGQAQGCIIGGNLSVLYGLQGTPYSLNCVLDKAEVRGERCILFIEDIAERHYHIDRMMQNLRLSGVLERIAGMVVGQFSDCEDDPSMGCTVQDTIAQAVEKYDFPVLFDFPAGHVERNLPLWFGVSGTLTVTPDTCTLSNGQKQACTHENKK